MNDRFTLVDIDIPFGRLVAIITKLMIASIPAMIIVWTVVMALSAIFAIAIGRSVPLF